MSENKNEQALRERYDALSAQERREYSLISQMCIRDRSSTSA